jgi:hypothetical protein
VTTPETELRAASDALLTSLDRLATLEEEKRQLPPDDPRLVALANEVEALAAEVLETANVQSHLAETAHVMAMTDAPDAPSRPIASVHRSLHDILRDWRAAERSLAQAAPGTGEAAAALARAGELRAEYQRAYEDTRRAVPEG